MNLTNERCWELHKPRIGRFRTVELKANNAGGAVRLLGWRYYGGDPAPISVVITEQGQRFHVAIKLSYCRITGDD